MFAKISMVGRTGRDIELKQGRGNNMFAAFPFATDYVYHNSAGDKVTETSWHRVLVSGKTAENVSRFCGKGSLLAISGRLRVRTYTKDGVENTATEVVADEVVFVQTKRPASEDEPESTPAPRTQSSPTTQRPATPTTPPKPAPAQPAAPEAPADDEGGGWDGVPY